MTEEHTSLKVDSSVVQDGYGYKDVDTYVKMPDGSEWLFRTYREYETGAEVKCEPRFSPGPDDEFGDEGAKATPPEVFAAYEAELPRVRQILDAPSLALPPVGALTVRSQEFTEPSIRFQIGSPEVILQIHKDRVIYKGVTVTDDAEQVDCFRDFLGGLCKARSRIPLMIHTQSAGLRPASDFDAVEIHEMVYDDNTGGYTTAGAAGDEAQYDPDAISVFVHCKAGGTECVADFPFDPSEPGTQASALASANALAAFVASVIANDQPHLPHTYIMRQEHLDLIEGVLKNG